jgi:hypothetical protein
VSGCRAAAVTAGAAEEPAREKRPAKKPLSQARCSGEKGAVSGRRGMEDIAEEN